MAQGEDEPGQRTPRRGVFSWGGVFVVVSILGFGLVSGQSVLQRGRRQSWKIQCCGNLKQVYGISLLYSNKVGMGYFP